MTKKEDPIPSGNGVNWQLILKIAIAVLSAILGAIGTAKVQAVGTFINGIL